MINFKEIPSEGEIWELFARDFLSELNFTVEIPPDRGPDGGRDIIITENIKGLLNKYQFRWLVSCKHFVHSNKSVNENDHERNILERVTGFNADGFIGFYSTLASSGLNQRLLQLKNTGQIKDYKIFDYKLIESILLGYGFAQIIVRYFPNSYKLVRPLHVIADEYVPLACDHCGKDLLKSLYSEEYKGIVAWVKNIQNDPIEYFDMYFACKGECDKKLENRYFRQYHATTSWKDLSDMAMPNEFLRWLMSLINVLYTNKYKITENVIDKEKLLIIGLAQKIFREVNEHERKRLEDLIKYALF